MQLPRFLPLALVGYASAESLMSVLMANSDQLSTLTDTIMNIPGGAAMFGSLKDVTIFAPSNDAFKQLMAQDSSFAEMAKNSTAVTMLLQYHAVPMVVASKDIMTKPTFASTLLTMGSSSSMTNMSMDMSTMARRRSTESSMSGAQILGVQMANSKAMVISGFRQMSTVTKADVMFDGGVLHIIDKVLTVPQSPSVTALDTGMTSLYGALKQANLVSAVDSLPMGSTIFVPNNMAFEAVGSAVEGASAKDLSSVLTYHVVKGAGMAMFSTQLSSMTGSTMSGSMASGGMTESMPASTMSGSMPAGMPASIMPESMPAGMPASTMPESMPAGMPASTMPEGMPAGMPASTMPEGMPAAGMPASTMPEGMPAGMPASTMPEGMPAAGMPASTMPEGMPAAGMPASTMPEGMPAAGMPASTMPEGMPATGMPASTMPEGMPAAGMPASTMPEGMPAAGMPASTMPEGMPAAGMPAAGMPASTMPESMPASTMPEGMPAGMPASTMPESMPAAAMPASGMPASTMPEGMPAGMPASTMPEGMPAAAMPASGMPASMPESMPGMEMKKAKRSEMTTMMLETLEGGKLTVRMDMSSGDLFINSAKVVMSDIITSNGVVHVIDNVLNPMMASAEPNPTATMQAPAFAGATPVQEAPFTSGVMATTTIMPATMAGGAAGPFAAVPTAALWAAGGAAAVLANL